MAYNTSNVIGTFWLHEPDFERLNPRMTRGILLHPTNGSGNPPWMCNARTADRYTRMDDALQVLLKLHMNLNKVSSLAGIGDPFEFKILFRSQK